MGRPNLACPSTLAYLFDRRFHSASVLGGAGSSFSRSLKNERDYA
jgi:hypothetical protein